MPINRTNNTVLNITFTRDDNELLKQIAKNQNTSVSKLCKSYILKCMKKDLKQLKEVLNNE